VYCTLTRCPCHPTMPMCCRCHNVYVFNTDGGHFLSWLNFLAQNSFYGGEGASFSISELENQQKEQNEAGGIVGEADLDPCGSEEVTRMVREIVAGSSTFENEGPLNVSPPPLRFVGLSETTQTHHHHHQIQQVLRCDDDVCCCSLPLMRCSLSLLVVEWNSHPPCILHLRQTHPSLCTLRNFFVGFTSWQPRPCPQRDPNSLHRQFSKGRRRRQEPKQK
jgi:hypothetical protein